MHPNPFARAQKAVELALEHPDVVWAAVDPWETTADGSEISVSLVIRLARPPEETCATIRRQLLENSAMAGVRKVHLSVRDVVE